jgi:hypothetical protein
MSNNNFNQYNGKPLDNEDCNDFIDHHRASLSSDASDGSDSFSTSELPKVIHDFNSFFLSLASSIETMRNRPSLIAEENKSRGCLPEPECRKLREHGR